MAAVRVRRYTNTGGLAPVLPRGWTQFVKLSQSPVVELEVSVVQGSVLGPLSFTVYCSPVGDEMLSQNMVFTATYTPMTHSSTLP